jgi:hypothetical protein
MIQHTSIDLDPWRSLGHRGSLNLIATILGSVGAWRFGPAQLLGDLRQASSWPPSPPCRRAHRLGAAVLHAVSRVFYFPLAPLPSVDDYSICSFGKNKVQASTPNLASTQARIPALDGNKPGIEHNRRDFDPSAWAKRPHCTCPYI